MTGLTGGTVSEEELDQMLGAIHREPWYGSERFAADAYGLAARHHGKKDPQGHTFWSDGRTAGAVDGALSNLSELGWDREEVFERLLRRPDRTLEALEGPFTIACVDATEDRVILATDKIGSRPPVYSRADGFVFASGLAPIMEALEAPILDLQGVSDLLLMGHMWGDTTFLEGVKTLHPATVIEYCNGEVTERRYWHPNYSPASPDEEYFHKLTNSYQQSVDRTARTVSGDVGLWLSGGLDSRATVSELARNAQNGDQFDSLVTYTYDANPGGGVNPRIAEEVAETLELPNETVPLTADQFIDVLEQTIDVTDGMVNWNFALNLTAVNNINRHDPDVLMEGIVGELVGQHLSRYHLTELSSLVESMYHSEASLDIEQVAEFVEAPVDPLGSYRREARRIDEPSFEEAVIDAHFQNYYPRLAHASNPVARTQAGTRIPYADGEFLSRAASLPIGWRMGTLPFSAGKLIYGVVKPKIRMMRVLDADLAEIPYERSRMKPIRPYPLHVVGFYASTALARLQSKPIYGGKSIPGEWYRHHEGLRQRLNDLIDDACERSFLNADAIRKCQQRHLDQEAEEMNILSSITTLELWLQRHFD